MGNGLAALALTLGLQAPAVEPRAGAGAQQDEIPAPRERPLYRAVLQQHALLRSPGRKDALAQLERWLAEWAESAFGLEGTPDPDRTLAGATALSALAHERARAEELYLLLSEVEARLDAHPEPDLALALAQGWSALLTVPFAEEIPVEERVTRLGAALRAAEAIAPEDQRDAFGSRLAHELHRHLRAARLASEAAEILEHALATFPGDPVTRPYLLSALADERRARGEFDRAWSSLTEAQEARERLASSGTSARELAVLDRTLAGVRCQLELATGLADRAALSLEEERRAVAAGARDAESQLDLWLNAAGVALATARPFALRRALAELEGATGAAGPFASRPGYRAQVRARAALVQEMLEELEPGPARAAELLAASFADEALDETHRAALGLRLFALAFRAGELDAAEAWLTRLEARPARSAERAPELSAALAAARARLALARAAGEEVLRGHLAGLRREYDSFLQSFGALPAREGGLGYLSWRNRGLLLGTLVDLCLALEGDAGPERAVDLLLPEQALGSLARRLGCPSGSLAEVRSELLAPGVGLLLYLPGYASTHLFCVDATGIAHREIPWKYELEALPRELDELLASSPARLSGDERATQLGRIEAAARALAQRLLPAPVPERVSAWRGVYVVGAELLGGIPFECLPVGDGTLGTRLALAALPSLPVGLELSRRARRRAPERAELELVLAAAPETAASSKERYPGLVPIPFGDEERASLAAPFARSLVFTGRDAHWTRLRSELAARRPRALHFFLHGVSDLERELSGGLVLAPCDADPDGLLWCEELLERDFESPELVILSACGSARGPRRTGDDGLAQLGGAFLSRGALATVQAAGEIALEPSLALLASFTRELARGAAPAEAMRLARLELARRADFAHPFYTCSLRVVGLGLEPFAPAPR